MDKQEMQIVRVASEPLPPTIKELSKYIWNKVGEVEITKESDIESGDPVMPVMNAVLRKVIVQVIRSCASYAEASAASPELIASILRDRADLAEKMRYHLMPIGVPHDVKDPEVK